MSSGNIAAFRRQDQSSELWWEGSRRNRALEQRQGSSSDRACKIEATENMVDYRRIGNTGQQQLVNNATSTSFLHELRDLWESPRGTVLRIEALALVAILLSFFLAVFGTCRRWSNSWIIQKGFLAANALFLSLGTYSIGLMQSSQVKSELYPIWAVSLLALLCCVDSANMSGIGNEGQIWKLLYQLCLYFGYVMLMSVSTISSDIGNIAICVLSAVTLIKGFHRSMAAFVLPSSMRNAIRDIPAHITARGCSFGDPDEISELPVDMKLDVMVEDGVVHEVSMGDIAYLIMKCRYANMKIESDLRACKDLCLSLSLSHLLQHRLLGSSSSSAQPAATAIRSWVPLVESYERAFKVVEAELAFMYDVLYTSNAFIHFYEARSGSIWAVASVLGICFVGAVAVVPGARTTRHASPGTIAVHTTVADSVITGVILVSLALLQVLQLLRSWTSNWARVAFACDFVRHVRERKYSIIDGPRRWSGRVPRENYRVTRADLSWEMRLRASLLKINWSDDKHYLWQQKLGQHSLMESITLPGSCCRRLFCCELVELGAPRKWLVARKCWALFGLRNMGRVLQQLLQTSNTEGALELHPDVTASVGDFVEKITGNDVSGWASSQLEGFHAEPILMWIKFSGDDAVGDTYVPCILMWHIATYYCQVAQLREQEQEQEAAVAADVEKDRRVATALSKYCAYLVVSAPRLLPGRTDATAMVYAKLRKRVRDAAIQNVERESSSSSAADKLLVAMENSERLHGRFDSFPESIYTMGVKLGKGLVGSLPAAPRWKVLAEFWVKALVFAAPSDNAEEHLQHLAQGGELITHLWAMLYHAGISRWQLTPDPHIKMGWDYIFRVRSLEDLKRRLLYSYDSYY